MQGRVRIGTQGWNYGAWVGPFYPTGTRAGDYLRTYAQAFDTVEVDSTFYAVPAPRVVRGWAQRTPDAFTFALKLPQEITHERRLRDSGDLLAEFVAAARELGPKLGPILVQLGPDFSPDWLPELEDFVPRLDPSLRWALEVRNGRWSEPVALERLRALLREHRVALALSDGRWLARELMLELVSAPTADFHYVRWMGPNRDIVDYSRVQFPRETELDHWSDALAAARAKGVDVFGYFNNHFSGHSPATAREMQRRLGMRPVEPSQLGEQTTLFD